MNKILPIHDPLIASTSSLSMLFTILPEHPEYLDWSYSYFISLRHRTTQRLVYEFTFKYKHNCPLIEYQLLKRETLINLNIDIIDFIKVQINNDIYVSLWLNHKYLLNSNKDISHNSFIYGFDDDEEIIYLADHFFSNNMKFKHSTCTYDEIKVAFNKMVSDKEDSFYIETYQIKKEKFNFAVSKILLRIKEQLLSYVNSHAYFNLDSQNAQYGLEIYDVQIEIFKNIKNNEMIDLRNLYFLYEHKQLMRRRMEYLHENSYFKMNTDIIQECTEIEKLAEKILNLSIKNNISYNYIKIEILINYLWSLKEKEYLFMSNLINCLI